MVSAADCPSFIRAHPGAAQTGGDRVSFGTPAQIRELATRRGPRLGRGAFGARHQRARVGQVPPRGLGHTGLPATAIDAQGLHAPVCPRDSRGCFVVL